MLKNNVYEYPAAVNMQRRAILNTFVFGSFAIEAEF